MSLFKRGENGCMPVLKNKTQGNYVNVYKGIVMDRSLSLKERGMMLTLLSLPDNWDLTVAGLRKILPDGKSAISKCLAALQSSGYLTREQSRGEGGMYRENIIEVHETPCSPYPQNRVADNQIADFRLAEKQTELNTKEINNQKLNNQRLINQSIHHKKEMTGRDVVETYLDIVKENIEYEYLLRDNPYKDDIIDEIVNLIAETVSIQRKNIRIAGTDYPYELVKGKFLKLNSSHIQYVLSCMDKNTTKVRNIKNYLLTSLYNAPNTIGNYFQAEVNHDIYGEGGVLCQ